MTAFERAQKILEEENEKKFEQERNFESQSIKDAQEWANKTGQKVEVEQEVNGTKFKRIINPETQQSSFSYGSGDTTVRGFAQRFFGNDAEANLEGIAKTVIPNFKAEKGADIGSYTFNASDIGLNEFKDGKSVGIGRYLANYLNKFNAPGMDDARTQAEQKIRVGINDMSFNSSNVMSSFDQTNKYNVRHRNINRELDAMGSSYDINFLKSDNVKRINKKLNSGESLSASKDIDIDGQKVSEVDIFNQVKNQVNSMKGQFAEILANNGYEADNPFDSDFGRNEGQHQVAYKAAYDRQEFLNYDVNEKGILTKIENQSSKFNYLSNAEKLNDFKRAKEAFAEDNFYNYLEKNENAFYGSDDAKALYNLHKSGAKLGTESENILFGFAASKNIDLKEDNAVIENLKSAATQELAKYNIDPYNVQYLKDGGLQLTQENGNFRISQQSIDRLSDDEKKKYQKLIDSNDVGKENLSELGGALDRRYRENKVVDSINSEAMKNVHKATDYSYNYNNNFQTGDINGSINTSGTNLDRTGSSDIFFGNTYGASSNVVYSEATNAERNAYKNNLFTGSANGINLNTMNSEFDSSNYNDSDINYEAISKDRQYIYGDYNNVSARYGYDLSGNVDLNIIDKEYADLGYDISKTETYSKSINGSSNVDEILKKNPNITLEELNNHYARGYSTPLGNYTASVNSRNANVSIDSGDFSQSGYSFQGPSFSAATNTILPSESVNIDPSVASNGYNPSNDFHFTHYGRGGATPTTSFDVAGSATAGEFVPIDSFYEIGDVTSTTINANQLQNFNSPNISYTVNDGSSGNVKKLSFDDIRKGASSNYDRITDSYAPSIYGNYALTKDQVLIENGITDEKLRKEILDAKSFDDLSPEAMGALYNSKTELSQRDINLGNFKLNKKEIASIEEMNPELGKKLREISAGDKAAILGRTREEVSKYLGMDKDGLTSKLEMKANASLDINDPKVARRVLEKLSSEHPEEALADLINFTGNRKGYGDYGQADQVLKSFRAGTLEKDLREGRLEKAYNIVSETIDKIHAKHGDTFKKEYGQYDGRISALKDKFSVENMRKQAKNFSKEDLARIDSTIDAGLEATAKRMKDLSGPMVQKSGNLGKAFGFLGSGKGKAILGVAGGMAAILGVASIAGNASEERERKRQEMNQLIAAQNANIRSGY